jgi:hypothetical protein
MLWRPLLGALVLSGLLIEVLLIVAVPLVRLSLASRSFVLTLEVVD